MNCPKCKQNRARRAERVDMVDNALNWVFFKPWLCHGCQYRFYAIREDLGLKVLRLRIAGRLPGAGFRKNRKRNRREMYIYGLAAALVAVLIYALMQQRIAQ
jgi:hypothetical protein